MASPWPDGKPTPAEMRILRHYADGQQIKHICTIVGQDTEAVRAVIDEWARFTRQRAKELVARWGKVTDLAVNPSAEPPPAHHKSEPPADQAGIKPGMKSDPPANPAPEPDPLRPPWQSKRTPRRPPDTEAPLPLELILIRAVKHGGEHGRRAGQLRQQILDLGAELDDLERVAVQQRRVDELRRQLDEEEAKLRQLTSEAPKQEEAAA